MATLYEQDFVRWTEETASKIRAGKLECIGREDWQNVAEEIESLGRAERRQLTSFLEQILIHLLKYQFQPEKRSGSWTTSITNHRFDAEDVMEDNPSLRPALNELVKKAYQRARRRAAQETRLEQDILPVDCPYTPDQILNHDWLP